MLITLNHIDGEDIMVMVRVQRSGGGMAAASPMTVNAGDVMSAITVTYTADGQVDNGLLKLTIPGTSEDWDAPTMEQRYDHRRRLQYRCEIWRCSYGSRTDRACRSCYR